ncbi:MAG: tRNA 2-selenouridine(34) synthase MnmH [Bacteroidetes bacterium RIFCSPLOWO2_12_FULL_35_15]|nr:MAG: tRNA 2-selenouridine(34) synthase MnmH [Bacteroidetes bacterium RIFCSPLOWO2_12_FULL_35_15]
MPTPINIHDFIELSKEHPIFDVRSPGEYNYGHIPGAISLPLFTDEERAVIGTAYKKESREAAVNKGLAFFGPKMKELATTAKKSTKGTIFLVHCWRGGMRSASVAWLLELYGFKVYLLIGGYKSYRHFVLESFSEDRKIVILGGRTGSGKTIILKELEKLGEQIIDLEQLAHHKGSSFGALGETPQPTQEMFENELFLQLQQTDKNKTVWLEDESNRIGSMVIPSSLFDKMRACKNVFIDLPFEIRSQYLTEEYGKFKPEDLKDAIKRIEKRLGGLATKTALEAIDSGNIKHAFELCLIYYDKTYTYGKNKRNPESVINCTFEKLEASVIAEGIKNYSR